MDKEEKMSNIKISKAKVKIEQRNAALLGAEITHYLVVSIPLENPIIIVKNQNVGKAEAYFLSKRDQEGDDSRKAEYERARSLLKWAGCCNAHLLGMHNEEHKLVFKFAFDTFEEVYRFEDYLKVNVK